MAPIRRYLRISKYSVLECRIYLENPADSRWLLDSRDPVLPRIFKTIKPLVLPKLREENERALAKKKSNPVKDVIAEDDFEVAIFLRESGTRHSLLTRQKKFGQRKNPDSNSDKRTNATGAGESILVESDEERDVSMSDIHETTTDNDDDLSKKRQPPNGPLSASERSKLGMSGDDAEDDKKLRMDTTYEGFSIWGWVLCLLVTRKGHKSRQANASSETSGQVLMEEWIATQVQPDLDEE